MPKLVLFAACEKTIIDQQTNVISLMSLLQDLNVQMPPGTAVPPNAVIPMPWAIVSIFQPTAGDAGKAFEQRSVLVDEHGQTLLESPIAVFELKTESHRIISQINGMPVGSAGSRLIKCRLRDRGTADWKEVGEYPIRIKWLTTTPPKIH